MQAIESHEQTQEAMALLQKRVKVYTLDGRETWVLIHVEVQGEPEGGVDPQAGTKMRPW
ncbi:MAG: hypothetical protein SVU24_07570 [Pseudomonadota bacterium]|jgi:hypothetical protein|nr:hypothetical protein [Pseudomonadota bacterium]